MSHVLINIFTTDPAHQEQLVRLAIKSIERTGTKQPGFISGTVHKSLDGSHVANVIEWETAAAWRAAHARNRGTNPEFDEHMVRVHRITRPEPHMYEIVFRVPVGRIDLVSGRPKSDENLD
jgi:heme-degrading monooxygenase HmoA